MGYAIELLFDNKITDAIIKIWRQFNLYGYGIDLLNLNSEPHVALAVYDAIENEATLSEITRIFSEQIPAFDIEIDGYGTFNTNEGVVFAKIRKSDILCKYHKKIHELSISKKLTSHHYYTPENWFPHCTLGINIKGEDIQNAINTALKFELPQIARVLKTSAIRFRPVETVCVYGLQKFQPEAGRFLGNQVGIKIDRKLNSTHPKYGYVYTCNYGYIPETKNEDGKEIDAYILGITEPISEFQGECIAIVHRYNDYDDKLIVVPEGLDFSNDEINEMINFQEQYFRHEIIRDGEARENLKKHRPANIA
jgi:inorganic pyrophosphatase